MSMFDFGIEDDIDDSPDAPPLETTAQKIIQLEPFAQLDLFQLLESLPPLISYSALPIRLSSSRNNITLSRRDLFDARFQLISEGHGDDSTESQSSKPTSALEFLDAPSDLVPGVYEGGLKTWECSLDLVSYLDGLEDSNDVYFSGKRVLEVGCGTGVPSMYILHRLFCGDSTAETHVHLQDYNASVLELITLPNIILAWYMSPSSEEYRASVTDPTECPHADTTVSGELPITSALKTAFTASLAKHGISLSFSSGPWESFQGHLESIGAPAYDLVLTSETIYRTESLPALIALLHRACAEPNSLCLVAAKVLYFGVGGGISEFVTALRSKSMIDAGCAGSAESVWERKVGVGRKIMRIHWS